MVNHAGPYRRREGKSYIFGLSTQDTPYQRGAVERLHLPYPLLSDEHLMLTKALSLPTFTAMGMTLLKRLTRVINDGVIEHVFYPVFPPDQNAAEVLAGLEAQCGQ
ncbi:redoxin family protein [Paraburkholderia sp. CNPSo 3076]|nr:redoxin family protein [Paraburkholderia sp. CNPSo 3076]